MYAIRSYYVDLPQALAEAALAEGSEWRVHFHVPIFLETMEHFDTTQAFLAEILQLHRQDPVSDHLEVETYTWDVLPPEYRKAELVITSYSIHYTKLYEPRPRSLRCNKVSRSQMSDWPATPTRSRPMGRAAR